MFSRVLALKWRPRHFDELVGQEHIKRTLTNALESKRLHHAYLFCGTRGVGKTTVARIFAKCLCCDKGITPEPCNQCSACNSIDMGNYADLIEVDAASRTKVEDTRELLGDMQFTPSKGKYKIYLIDEVHMLSNHSFNALLKTLEEPPSHIIFLFATTEPQKLPVTVLSRCLRFNLRAVSQKIIAYKLREILPQEGVSFDEDSLFMLSYYASGSVRDALSLTDQAIAYCNSKLEASKIADMLGVSGLLPAEELLGYVTKGDLRSLLSAMAMIEKEGGDFNELWDSIMGSLQELAVLALDPGSLKLNQDRYSNSTNNLDSLMGKFTPEELQLYYQIALSTKKEIAFVKSPRQGSEMGLIRMLSMQPLAEALIDEKLGKNRVLSRYADNFNNISETSSQTGSAEVVKEGLTKEELTKEELTKEELTKEELTKEELTKEELTKEGLTKEELTKEELTKEELTKEELTKEESQTGSVEVVGGLDDLDSITNSNATKPIDENDYTQAENWAELVSALNLEGLAASLLKDTRLVDIYGSIWVVNCHSHVKEILTNELIHSIESAINTEIKQQISIEIQVGPAQDTPAMFISKKHKELVQKVSQEPIVATILNKYDGKLNEDSIQQLKQPKD